MPSAKMQGMMEPNLAHELRLKRKERCSAEKSQFMNWKVSVLHKPSPKKTRSADV